MNSNAIVVGTGTSILGKKHGKQIDKHDFILRSGRSFVEDQKQLWREDTGTRTTHVWVTHYHLNYIDKIPNDLNLLLLFSDFDFYNEPLMIYNHYNINTNRLHFDYYMKYNNKKISFFSVNDLTLLNKEAKITNNGKKYSMSAGVQAIIYAIQNFKKVCITGFDHFQTGFYFNEKSQVKKQSYIYKSHNSFLEACFIQDLLRKKLIHQL